MADNETSRGRRGGRRRDSGEAADSAGERSGGAARPQSDFGPADDALRRLGDRLEQATSAAERLIAQAADAARIADRVKPPPSGWQAREDAIPPPAPADVSLLLQSLRDLIPADLERRLVEAIRELLLAIRALIDWYLERLEQRRSQPVEVQDIPLT